MDNLNYIELGGALGVISLTLQLITTRPLRNAFLVLLLILGAIFITSYPVPAKDYDDFWNILQLIMIVTFVIMTAIETAHALLMNNQNKVFIKTFLGILFSAVILIIVGYLNNSAVILIIVGYLNNSFVDSKNFLFVSVWLFLIIVFIFDEKRFNKNYKTIENYRNNQNNKIDIKGEFKKFKRTINRQIAYLKNNWGRILKISVVILLNISAIFFIYLVIETVKKTDELPYKYYFFSDTVVEISLFALFLGFILILHASLLKDNPNWPINDYPDWPINYDPDYPNGIKSSKASILFIKLLSSVEMIIGVVCIFISTNNFVLLYQFFCQQSGDFYWCG